MNKQMNATPLRLLVDNSVRSFGVVAHGTDVALPGWGNRLAKCALPERKRKCALPERKRKRG